jgi:hypothetical protein
VHGASDKSGALPDRDGVPLDDLAATVFTALGINPEAEVYDRLNRPLPVSRGRAVPALFA